MQRFRKLASMMGVEHAVILAPMAGGTSTPALVAAVSNAGGLGSLGAGYMTPDDIAKAIAEIHERTEQTVRGEPVRRRLRRHRLL